MLYLATISNRVFAECAHVDHVAGNSTNRGDSTGYDYKAAEPWARGVLASYADNDSPDKVNYSKRVCPSWLYYYDAKKMLTVVRLPKFVRLWRARVLASCVRNVSKVIMGVRGRLLVSAGCRHFVSNSDVILARKILRGLGEKTERDSMIVVPFENRVVMLGVDHAVWRFRSAGRLAFEKEREQVYDRHKDESEFLFPASEFGWSNPIPDDLFEDMICELLHREPNVAKARKASPTRQGDGGRDLLLDVVRPPSARDIDERMFGSTVRVVAQCKAMSSTVGKSKVQDIRDVVEHFNAHGYFLIVASELAGGLVEHLDRLRADRNWFVDWWTRIEIEQRLRRHEDITARYSAVVKPKRS